MSTANPARGTTQYKRLAAYVNRPRPGGRCALCGGLIVYGQRGHPLSPSLDHIIAISKGGALLDPRNCQLAHLKCNLDKSDRPATLMGGDPEHAGQTVSNNSRQW